MQAASRSAHPKATHLLRPRSSISVITRTNHVSCTCKHKHHFNAISSATESFQWHFRFSAQNYTVDSFFVCSIRAICVAQQIVPDLPTPISCELLIQEGIYWEGGGWCLVQDSYSPVN